jgi:hypothetical protein
LLPNLSAQEINPDSVNRVVAAVFRQGAYRRSLRRTLAEQILDWFADLFRSVGSAMDSHPALRYIAAALILTLILMIMARVAYTRQMERAAMPARVSARQNGGLRDPWASAQNAALAGNYVEAAHALYFAVLQALAATDRLVVDSAKTVGDYTRELRRASSHSLPLYRDFARIYEPIVWGSRDCDRSRFEQLSGIASRLTGRNL